MKASDLGMATMKITGKFVKKFMKITNSQNRMIE